MGTDHDDTRDGAGNNDTSDHDTGNEDGAVRTAFRTCPLCEAGCGLEITVKGAPGAEQVTRIRGDQADVFSHGFICPKGSTLKQLHDDPDRLRRPLVKRNGVHEEVEWAEAWAVIADRLPAITAAHGREAVGVYLGNPSAHSLSALLYNRSLLQALGTRRRFSASTVDQMPRQVAAAYVFGTAVSVPVPDLDHADFLIIIGANPYASNGSLCTAPDFPGRLEAIRARGGAVVVVDPRRSKTAEEADRWLPIRPGTDALMLAAERAWNLMKLFNLREGEKPEDSAFPRRFYEQRVKGNALDEEKTREVLKKYYHARGWDPETGMPTEEKLRQLGIIF